MGITDPNEDEQEIFNSIDWSTESNYTGYEDDELDDDDYIMKYGELNDDFDPLMTDVNMGTDFDD